MFGRALESGAGFAVGVLGGHAFSLCALSHFALGRVEAGEQGSRPAARAAALSRRSDQLSSSSVRQGVREDNWSEGRFRCRWLRKFKNFHP